MHSIGFGFFEDWIVFIEETLLQSFGTGENTNEDDSDIGQINLYRTDDIRWKHTRTLPGKGEW